ncbi:MAG TPA: hypothetical protein PKE00_17460 [Planctomycetota bacterium]|nr:hypothetical protein [Planctomycetota bacterium]
MRIVQSLRRALACFALLVTLGAASCASGLHEDRELAVDDLPIDILWSICLDAAQTEFRIDPAQMDIGKRSFVTRWRKDVRPLGMGVRRRAQFRIERRTEGSREHNPEAGVPTILYWVERQRYGDMSTPLEPKEDEWDDAGQDGEVERRLYRHLTIRIDQARGVALRKPERIDLGDPLRGKTR